MSLPPSATASGDILAMALLAGQSAGLVHDIRPAAHIVAECVDGVDRVSAQLTKVLRAMQDVPRASA
jgi:hypothetical protein